jgi:2-C-methyl-D-erythritol 2,4-cyclodiphosphate synthase
MYRIGIGHDTHRLAAGRPLVLGGVTVESEHFPDNDPRWQGADSLQLLARVMWLASERGYRVVNADATVLLERPKLRPHVQEMRQRLAEVLGVGVDCVSVKAKSGEGLDAVGEWRAVTAQAVVLLERT